LAFDATDPPQIPPTTLHFSPKLFVSISAAYYREPDTESPIVLSRLTALRRRKMTRAAREMCELFYLLQVDDTSSTTRLPCMKCVYISGCCHSAADLWLG
jgi:hypothetical protein